MQKSDRKRIVSPRGPRAQRSICGIAGALLLSVALEGKAADSEFVRTLGFQPLEIHSFKPGSSRLVVEDLNHDGLDDVIFANNHVSRLEILLRKPGLTATGDLPELESCFEDRGMTVDQGIRELLVEDLNGDQLKDIVTFGSALGLQIRYQHQDGTFADPERIFLKNLDDVTSLYIEDLNGDGLKDIAVCRRRSAELLWNASSIPFQKSKELTFSGNSCYHIEAIDLNGDEIKDLAFFFNTSSNPLVVRYGTGDGKFGVEQPVDLPPCHFKLMLGGDRKQPQFGVVLKNRLAFRTYAFEEVERPGLLNTQETAPLRIGLEGTESRRQPAWLVGKFNDDSYEDLLIAAPELSRLHLYRGIKNGLDPEPYPIDSLSQVDRISRLANGDVLVVSKKEKIAAVHSAAALEKFPTILKTPGAVLAGCAIESGLDCWLVCKDEANGVKLVRRDPDSEAMESFPLEGLSNDPTDLLAFSLPDGKVGLILFMTYGAPRMYLFDGGEIHMLTSEAFRAIAQELDRNSIYLETPGDGKFIRIAQGAVARRFIWKGDHYDVDWQYNPENPQGELAASCDYLLSSGASGCMFYDRNSSDLVYFADSGKECGKIHLTNADPSVFDLVQLKNGSQDIILLIAQSGINEVVGNGVRLEASVLSEYTSPAEEALLAYATDVELGAPPKPMIALVDSANRTVEMIREDAGKLLKDVSFEVFLVSDFANQRGYGIEPHDLASGDLNGDGVGDLLVLCQDKLLIYLGE